MMESNGLFTNTMPILFPPTLTPTIMKKLSNCTWGMGRYMSAENLPDNFPEKFLWLSGQR